VKSSFTTKKILYFLIPALIFSAGMVLLVILSPRHGLIEQTENYSQANRRMKEGSKLVSIPLKFDQNLFSKAVRSFPLNSGDTSQKNTQPLIKGAVVPHHDLADNLIAQIFQKIALDQKEIKKVIIIGPNHPDAGIDEAISGYLSWNFLGTMVNTDQVSVDSLFENNLVKINNDVLAKEHSIFTIIPFVHHYFSEATVVPIILSSKHDIKKCEKLANGLKNLVDKNTIVIASVDFSHYLPSFIAPQKDIITKQALEKFDYETISKLDNDYLDSPPSIITLLKTMRNLPTTHMTMVSNTNSGILLHQEVQSSTSYFTYIFTQD
jgi:AmmeMemoRadiSam system protein B